MKTMKKYIALALAGIMALTVACEREILPPAVDMDGYITLNLSVNVPDMQQVETRAVDPDGGGVQNITLFCFDRYGLFVSTVSAKVTPDEPDESGYSLSGSFTAKIPDHVEVVHLIGNQNLTYFQEGDYVNKSEVEVMTSIQASAGRMIYWSRENVADLVPGSSVTLLRNQAKVSVEVAPGVDFTEKGWVVVNTNAFGTVAPYNQEAGGFVAPTLSRPFVTDPGDDTKLTSYYDVRVSDVEYYFETENTEADPVDMIIRGGDGLYYRVSMLDQDGNHVMIMRNHHYVVNIVGALSYGQDTFADALTAPATNNVWVSISDSVKEVYDNEYMLSVDETFVVIGAEEFSSNNTIDLYYTIADRSGNALTDEDTAQVYWLDGNDVAEHSFIHNFSPSSGRGHLTVTLLNMGGQEKREGTLFVKKGRLNRKIKIVTVKTQKFEPAWITTNVYGVATGENITMMFTIPETCPQELFPMEVLISTDVLDIRNESGMALPVRREGDPGYGEPNGIGYKYVLTVTGTGKQRVYLETILEQEQESYTQVTIEARHFETLSKTSTFHIEENKWILLHNLRAYSAETPADEVIYYYLVPQKKNAVVKFPTHLGKDIVFNEDNTIKSYTAVTPDEKDEFLLYSRYLDHDETNPYNNFTFYPVDEDNWSSGGRVYGFVRNEYGQASEAEFHMVTNSSRSAEVVRIASNPAGSKSVTGTGLCEGTQYRSAIFELSNFHPFHFAAQITDNNSNTYGTVITGTNEEVTDNVQLSYEPGQEVKIAFDVTSFKSSIQNVSDDDQMSVDPFGTAFEIYIDAPMLELADDFGGKVKEDPSVPGRFIYSVAADRESERVGTNALVKDDSQLDAYREPLGAAVDQSGERKELTFKTKDIVSEGQITISSEEDIVVFYQKTFNVTNSPMTGTIRFGTESSSQPVPAGAFVPFEVLPTFNRIGVMTINDGGNYQLHLRKEYRYNWTTDDVKLQYVSGGVTYEAVFNSLSELYGATDILLTPAGSK